MIYFNFIIVETIKPPRSPGLTNTFMSEYYRLFVGGTLENTSDIDQLSGCIRGLKIGDKVFALQQEAYQNPGLIYFMIILICFAY